MEKIPTTTTEILFKNRYEIYNEVIKDFPFLKDHCNVYQKVNGDLRVEIHDGNDDLSKRKYFSYELEVISKEIIKDYIKNFKL